VIKSGQSQTSMAELALDKPESKFSLEVNKMKKYVLIGAYSPDSSQDSIKIIDTSDDMEKLKNIWETIDAFYSEMEETFDGTLSEKAIKMIENKGYLNDLFELFHDTVLWTIQVVGIFEAVKTNPVYSSSIK